MLRISQEDKHTIKCAAELIGKSVTEFILGASLKEAERVSKNPPRGQHGGVAGWFRAMCAGAAQGGHNGYEFPAYRLATSLGTEMPDDVDVQEWIEIVDGLKKVLAAGNNNAVLLWFHVRYPKWLALIPSRRRDQFIHGVLRAYEDGQVGV